MPEEPVKFENAIVRLADLVVARDWLENYLFVNCEVVGPAILVPTDETKINDCVFDVPSLDALLWPVEMDRPEVTGAVGLRNVWFEKCTFRKIGVAVRVDQLEQFRASFGG